jgi:hypothetical protein
MPSMLFHVCFSSYSSTWRVSEGGFPALVIASEHAIWLPHDNNPLQAITCYMESSISANVLTEIQDSFGDKILMIAAAMQPEGALSQYHIEVADPLTNVVMNNLLRMPMDFTYYTNLLKSSPIAHTQRPFKPLKGIAKMRQWATNIFKSMTHLK